MEEALSAIIQWLAEAKSSPCNQKLRAKNSLPCSYPFRLSGPGSLRQERGSTLVEYAMILSLFLLLTMGVLEFGRAVWAYNSLSHGAREGSRYAIVRGADSGRAATVEDVQDFVRNRLPSLAPVEVTTSWDPDNQAGSVVQVQVQYAFNPIVPLLPPITLSSTSRMVISF